jgi:hypothetical protein
LELTQKQMHPVLIDNLLNRYPLIIEGIKEIGKYRELLTSVLPSLSTLNLPEYGYEKGLIKTNNSFHTHSNPITD